MGPGALRLQRSAEESLWSMVENVVRSHGLAGLAVGVVRNGEVALSRGFGVRDVGTLEPVTSDTIFHLGSVSKSFVATAVVGLATRRAGVQEPALLRVLRYRGALPAGPPRASGEHLVRQRTTR